LGLTKPLYLFFVALSFYLLYKSRADEVYTIWGAVPSTFIIIFFTATFLLVLITLSSEKTEFKMLFLIVHSILSLTFYALVFPFGRTGVPQMVLGEIRLIFENITPVGLTTWPTLPAGNILLQIYHWSRGYNLESLLNVIFARMFGIDVYWTNLLLVPLLWGTFVPMLAFAITKELCKSEKISVFAGLAVLAFPTLIFYGSFSTHNSLAFIFLFGSLYFFLKYLGSSESKWPILMLLTCSASFLSHFLAGIVAFSLLPLAIAFKSYTKMKEESSTEAKINLFLAIGICTSLLPLALLSHRFFFHITTTFSLDKLSTYSIIEALAVFLLGEYTYFPFSTALAFAIGPLLGIIGMIYLLRSVKQGSNKNLQALALFLSIAFLMILANYGITKLFMVNVPFEEERLWALRDFMAVPLVAFLVGSFITFMHQKTLNMSNEICSRLRLNVKSIVPYIIFALLLSGWITISVYHAYPVYSPLQTTPYEVEAVKYIDETSNGTYIAIGDPWIIFAGEMFVGVHNPRAFYFFYQDPDGAALFTKMKNNPSNDTLVEAMEYNNATVAYFIIEKPRLGDQEFNRIILQAEQNRVAVYETFGKGKLYIFYYKK